MVSFISDFDIWMAVVGSLVLAVFLVCAWYLFKDEGVDEIDPHEEMLWRILDKGDKS